MGRTAYPWRVGSPQERSLIDPEVPSRTAKSSEELGVE